MLVYNCRSDKIEPMLNEQQQRDIHILAILATNKHCFKVRCNASSYTRVFRSVRTAPIFQKTRDTCFRKKVKPLDV